MVATLIFLFSFFSSPSLAGTWTQIDHQTVYLKGEILSDEWNRFIEIDRTQLKTLVVDSGGGDVEATLRIAQALRPIGYTIIVERICASSCANYLFTAAKEKWIREGVVGYHGNVRACVENGVFRKQLEEMSTPEATIEKLLAEMQKLSLKESLFLEEIGVSPKLFDLSCTADKGAGDGQIYDLLLPSRENFRLYGIKNVKGQQSLKIVEELRKAGHTVLIQ